MKRLACLIAGVLSMSAAAFAQTSPPPPVSAPVKRSAEEGRPFIRGYAPMNVGGNGQFWAIVQDKRGVIYAGTGAAVLEFDGASWRRIPLGSLVGVARSLAIDDTGRIYVGSVHDLGYLAPDAHGQLAFVSLRDKLPADARDVKVVFRTHLVEDGVVFQSERALYRWANGAFSVIPAPSRFHRSSLVDGRIYVPVPESGLNVLEHDTLRPLPGTERLANEPFPVVLRYDAKRLLIGTRNDGLFLYDGATLAPFATDLDSTLKEAGLYRGTDLPDGTFALSTTSAGMGIVDRQGRRVALVNRAAGLPSDVVYYTMRDAQGALWLALDAGLARVETPSPVSFFDNSDGLGGGIAAAIRHDGRLYLALQTGIRYLDPTPARTGAPRLLPVERSSTSQCWGFAEMRVEGRSTPALLATCNEGLYEIRGTTAVPIKTPKDLSFNSYGVRVSAVDPSRVWIGLRDGLASFRYEHGRWVDEGRVEGISEYVRSIFEERDGSLWAGTETEGVLHVRFATSPVPNAPRPAPSVERFGTAQGLPEGGIAVVNIGGAPYFALGTDAPYIARFDNAQRRFVRDKAFDIVGVDPIAGGLGLVGASDGRAYLNPGAWLDGYRYAVVTGDKVELRQFEPQGITATGS